MPPAKTVTLTIRLDPLDYKIVRNISRKQGLDARNFSLTLHDIIQDWWRLRLMAETQAGRRPANPYPGGPDLHVRIVGSIAIPD